MKKIHILCLGSVFLALSCKKPVDVIEINELPVPKAIIEIGPDEGEIITMSEVSFIWKGVEERLNQFNYGLIYENKQLLFKGRTGKTDTTFKDLDEGVYTFYLKEIFSSGDIQNDSTGRTFTIDAIRGPAIWLKKRYNKVSNGDSFKIELIAEDVSDLMGFYTKISFANWPFNVTSITQGDFFNNNADEILFKQDTNNNYLEIYLIKIGGQQSSVNKTGIIAQIDFEVAHWFAGEEIVKFEQWNLRNSDNNSITVVKQVNSKVKIK